jgi:hypothetical protein
MSLELVDLTRFDHADAALIERFLKGERHRSGCTRSVNEIDGEILVDVWSGDAVVVVGGSDARRHGDGTQQHDASCQRKHLHDNTLSG